MLSFRAARGSVRNLTLRQAGGVCECAVEIAGGELALEDCVIESEGDAAVLVRGAGARPHIARNVIREAAGVGVHVTGWAAPVLEDNEISGCRLDGLVVSNGGNPRVRRNRITGCRTAGILVRDGGEGYAPPPPPPPPPPRPPPPPHPHSPYACPYRTNARA